MEGLPQITPWTNEATARNAQAFVPPSFRGSSDAGMPRSISCETGGGAGGARDPCSMEWVDIFVAGSTRCGGFYDRLVPGLEASSAGGGRSKIEISALRPYFREEPAEVVECRTNRGSDELKLIGHPRGEGTRLNGGVKWRFRRTGSSWWGA